MESERAGCKRLRTWERRINTAKKKHRSSLKNWSVCGFSTKRNTEFLQLRTITKELKSQEQQINSIDDIIQFTQNIDPSSSSSLQPIHRIPCQFLSISNFIEYYEIPKRPIIIQNIPEIEQWDAYHKWNFKYLMNFKNRYFKIGEDDDGYKIKTRMKYFLKYLHNNTDDSPLYVFDSNYDTDEESKQLLSEYKVPSYFPEDLFSLVGEKKRPPYRWFLVGPERSGTCIHIDPLGTSAWNTLLHGTKRWVLFPPGTPKHIVKGTDCIRKGEDDEATNYFIDILPRIKQKYCFRSISSISHHTTTTTSSSSSSSSLPLSSSSSSSSSSSPTTTIDSDTTSCCITSNTNTPPPVTSTTATTPSAGVTAMTDGGVQVVEFLQYAGDTVFIPGGWWHAVINLTDTIAVTQNFCSSANFAQVWRKTRVGRKKMSASWLKRLKRAAATAANDRDCMCSAAGVDTSITQITHNNNNSSSNSSSSHSSSNNSSSSSSSSSTAYMKTKKNERALESSCDEATPTVHSSPLSHTHCCSRCRYSHLVALAEELNREDHFVMYERDKSGSNKTTGGSNKSKSSNTSNKSNDNNSSSNNNNNNNNNNSSS